MYSFKGKYFYLIILLSGGCQITFCQSFTYSHFLAVHRNELRNTSRDTFLENSLPQTNQLTNFQPTYLKNSTDSLPSGPSLQNEEINTTKLYIVCGALLGTMTGMQIYQNNGWWKGYKEPFHFQEDLVYSLNVDKFGHFEGGIALGYVISKSLQWANVPEEAAMWCGSGGSLLFQTFLEYQDGIHEWGFDRVDWASDVAGALWPIAQHHSAFLREFTWKFSYYPTSLLGTTGGSGFVGQKHLIVDDYEGQTIWVSVHCKSFLPEPLKSVTPEFLSLAVGRGCRDIAGGVNAQYSVLILALDIDVGKILPSNPPWMKTLAECLNFIHLPMPAVQIYPSAIWYGLYF